MEKLHKKLMERNGWYADYHKHKSHQVIQWLVLVLVILGFATLIAFRVNSPDYKTYGKSSKADQAQADFTTITAQLLNAASAYKKATPEEQVNLKIGLEQLAQQRKQDMLAALDKNPKAVARAVIPPGLLKQMPAEISSFLETPATVLGKAEVIHGDDFKNNQERTDLYVTGSDRIRYHVRVDESSLGKITTGSSIKVSGSLFDTNLIPQDSPNSLTITAQATTSASVHKKVAVILFNFQDDQSMGSSQDDARAKMFTNPDSINNFYQENSFGQWDLVGSLRQDGDVFGYYTIPYSKSVCDTTNWSTSANNLAARDGFVDSNYNSVVYLFPDTSACYFSGQASVGGSPARAWLNTGSFNNLVTVHEVGHNFSFMHASSLNCVDSTGAAVSISNNCTYSEYGDPYDIMGGGAGYWHVSNYHKGQTGTYAPNSWIPTSNVLTLSSGQSGTYTLVPQEYSGTGIQTIRIPRDYTATGSSGYTYVINPGYYYLEFRRPYGFDNFDLDPTHKPNINGVIVRLAPDFSASSNSMLVDTSPSTPGAYDTPITAGQTFTDSDYGISITTQSISDTGAVVSITTGQAPCIRANPQAGMGSVSTIAGYTTTIGFSVANKDSSACGPSTFTVTSSLPTGWYQTPATFTVTIAPGATAYTNINITPSSNAAPGDYTVTETTVNNNAPSYQTVSPTTFTIRSTSGGGGGGDTTKPTISIISPAGGAVLAARSKVTLSASASDNVGVTHVLFTVNGKRTCDDKATPYTCAWSVPRGSAAYTLSATAYDAAGNYQTATIYVTAQ